MLKIMLAGSAPLVLLMFTAIAAGSPRPADGPQKKTDETKALYEASCQMCHGVDGKTTVPEMTFVGRKWKTKTVAASAKVIRAGVRGTAMLPFEGKLTDEQILALARYVRALDSAEARKKK